MCRVEYYSKQHWQNRLISFLLETQEQIRTRNTGASVTDSIRENQEESVRTFVTAILADFP